MAYSRRLSFFDGEIVNTLNTDLKNIQPTCITYGRGIFWLGDAYGLVHRIDRVLHITSFRAHDVRVDCVHQLKHHDLLITVGHDESNQEHLKVWNLSKWSHKSNPFCCRSTSIVPTGFAQSSVTCLAVDEGLQFMVLGHLNGLVQLLRGDITRERQCKRHVIYEFMSPVTGLGLFVSDQSERMNFKSSNQKTDPTQVIARTHIPGPVVFAASTKTIMSFVIGRRDEVQFKTVLDRFGAQPNCTAMILSDSVTGSHPQFAVACPDAVYFYNWDGRGPCLAIDGEKFALALFKNYLVIAKSTSSTNTDSYYSAENSAVNIQTTAPRCGVVVVQDYNNKFVAGEYQFSNFFALFIEWDAIYLLHYPPISDPAKSEENIMSRLIEKDTRTKLEVLFSKKNFNLAIEIAKSQHFSEDELAHIFWRYADHLYKQKDYDGAIRVYIKTIGKLEASFVIQRFLEGNHIAQLICYLEELRNAQLASGDHLILLLICYCRLQDHERIIQFVNDSTMVNNISDIKSAIRVLRHSHFSDAAIILAKNAGRTPELIGLLIEDSNDGLDALQNMAAFSFDEALRVFCDYGHLLMARHSVETIQFLKKLCDHPDASRINVQHFLKIFVNNSTGLMHFLEHYLGNATSTVASGLADTLLELILHEASQLKTNVNNELVAKRNELFNMALRLLSNDKFHYDWKNALVLCHQRQFFDGCLYLWEKQKLFDQVLKHYVDMNNADEVFQTCEKFGDQMPSLWLTALSYFAQKPDRSDALKHVIDEVDRHNLMSPIAVLQLLSINAKNVCTVGSIREYVLRHLEASGSQIKAVQRDVNQLRQETMRNRDVVRNLQSQIKIFQQQKCALCHQSLDVPSVHFLCDHSYHKICFENYASGDRGCPECAPKNRKLLVEASNILSSSKTTAPLSARHVIDQLTSALRSCRIMTETDTSSKHFDSPYLSKALAQVLSTTSVLSRTRSQSPVVTNPNINTNFSTNQFNAPVKSHDSPKLQKSPSVSSSQLQSSALQSGIVQTSIPTNPFPIVSSSSLGYSSARENSAVSDKSQFTTQPSVNQVSTNPFDSNNAAEVMGEKSKNLFIAVPKTVVNSNQESDVGLGNSVHVKEMACSSNPFEEE